jgi:hypothetical protein
MKSFTYVFTTLASALAIFSQPAIATYIRADHQFNVDNNAINIGTKNRKNLLGCSKAKPCINDRIAELKNFPTSSNQPIAAKPSYQEIGLVKIALVQKAPIIGVIKSKVDSGCGCYLEVGKRKSAKPVFTYAYLASETPIATMNIDGQDIQLRQISKRKGIERYAYQDITVIVTFSLVKSEYEGGSYKAKIVARRGTKSTTVQATGYCGC